MTIEFWIQIVIYAISIGSFAGIVLTKIGYLEKKMDKHNGLIERMAVVEQTCKSAHKRIDGIDKYEKGGIEYGKTKQV
jgi:hypothetical protein